MDIGQIFENNRRWVEEKLRIDAITDEEHRYKRLVELNVLKQCVNMIKTSDVQMAWKERKLQVHGWVFDVRTGNLIDLEIDFEKIL